MQDRQSEAPLRASVEERLKAGDRRFSRLEARLDKSDAERREHLQKQDTEIAEIKALMAEMRGDTRAIIETWNDGARAVRFFCRLAQAWRFMLRQVAFPVVITLLAIYAALYYAEHGHFPTLLADTVKLILASI